MPILQASMCDEVILNTEKKISKPSFHGDAESTL